MYSTTASQTSATALLNVNSDSSVIASRIPALTQPAKSSSAFGNGLSYSVLYSVLNYYLFHH